MSKLVNILKSSTKIAGTAVATYWGIEQGAHLGEYFSSIQYLPEGVQGFTAFISGLLGNKILGLIIDKNRISENEVYSIASLNAFVSSKNDLRNINTKKSLEQISKNLVEVYAINECQTSIGSGLMITTNGYILTAHHVIRDVLKGDNYKIKIKTSNGKTYHMQKGMAWYNKNTDIAILKVEKLFNGFAKPIKAKVDLSGKLSKGDEVRVLGFRDGQKYNSIGMVTNSSLVWNNNGVQVTDLFQTDIRGKQGQSGGVIINGDGELVGITIFSKNNPGEKIGLVGGAKISNAINYINEIAAKQSAKMFNY